MKRHFCTECGQTVIETELDQGLAVRIDNSVYCHACAQELEQKKEEEKEKVRKAALKEDKKKEEEKEEEQKSESEQGFLDKEEIDRMKEKEKISETPDEDEEIEESEELTEEDIDTEDMVAVPEEEPEEEESEEESLVEVDLDEEDTKEEELPPEKIEEENKEKKPVPASSSRRLKSARGRGSGSSRRAKTAASSRRARVAASSGSSRLQAANGEIPASERRRISFRDRPGDEKMKIVVLTISALFIIIGFLGLIVRGCGGSGGRQRIEIKTEAKELIDQARKLKKQGISLYHKGDYDGSLIKYYAAQSKYEKVLEKVRNQQLSPEEKAEGLSYDWIDDEYCKLGPLILQSREMKVRTDNRRERFNK